MYKPSTVIFIILLASLFLGTATMADTQRLVMTKLASANPCAMQANPCAKKHPCDTKKHNPCGVKEGNPCSMKHNPCAMGRRDQSLLRRR